MPVLTLTHPPKPRGRAKRTVILDGIELDAVLRARAPKKKINRQVGLSPKAKPRTAENTKVGIPGLRPRKGICRADTLAEASPNLGGLEFLGVFQSRSTVEDVLILRSWMASKGLREIDPMFSICEFAACFERCVKPRHAWSHFAAAEEPRARRFLAAQAAALLPELISENSETTIRSKGYTQ